MDRKNIILSLVVSFVFLFYTVLDYFGYIRYLRIHIGSMNSYIENYTKLNKGDKNRVVISFKYDTGDGNNEKLRPFLKSILNQTVRVEDISMYTSYENASKIPSDLKRIVTVCGTNSKKNNEEFRLCIFKEPDNNTKILILNPAFVYGKDFVESMIEESNNNPSKIVLSSDGNGVLIKTSFINSSNENIFSNQNWIESEDDKKKTVLKYKENYKSMKFVVT